MKVFHAPSQRGSRALAILLTGALSAQAQAQTSQPSAQSAADKPPESKGMLPIPDYSGGWSNGRALTGDWGGTRQDWAKHGLTFDLDWTQTGQGATSGGRSSEWAWGGSIDYVLHADLMRMGVMDGALLTMRAETRYGESVNGESGLLLPVNTDAYFPLTDKPDEDLPLAITELNYTQFLSETFGVLAGKITTMDADPNAFASGRGRDQFMNYNFVQNSVTARTAPYSTLGVGALWLPSKSITVSSIVMNSTDSSTTSGFDDFGEGGLWVSEADFKYDCAGLPGGMNVGATYAFDGDFTKLGGQLEGTPGTGIGPEKKSDSWATYWSAWQYVLTEATDSDASKTLGAKPDMEGLGLFARFGVADQDTNPVAWSGSIGVGGRGLIPGRDHDSYGLGYFFMDLQQPRTTVFGLLDDSSQGAELYYDIALLKSVSLTLDTQWVRSAFTGIDDAYIFGVRLNASL